MRLQLAADQQVAESVTTCRRRGTMARAVIINGESLRSTLFVAVNGGRECASIPGECGCTHAEQRLVVQALKSTEKLDPRVSAVLTTLEPCEQCANLIVECGLFSSVAWLQEYRGGKGRETLKRGGIMVIDACGPFMPLGGST